MDNLNVLREREEAVREYSLRNANKQVMEKKRRARINTCLTELKLLVLQGLNKDASQYSKLEKADILEMTVKYLKSVENSNTNTISSKCEDPRKTSSYREGFQECAKRVQTYLKSSPTAQQAVRLQMMNCLADKTNGTSKIEDKENVQPRRVPLMDTKQYGPNVLNSRPMKSVCRNRMTARQNHNDSYYGNENVTPVNHRVTIPTTLPSVSSLPPFDQSGLQNCENSAPLNFATNLVVSNVEQRTGYSANDFSDFDVSPSHFISAKTDYVWRPW